MKRALAERVKQERLGSPVETPSSNGAAHQTLAAKPPPELSSNLLNGGNSASADHIPRRPSAESSHPNPPQSMDTEPDDPPTSVKKRPRSPNATSSGNVSSYTEEPAKKRPGRPRKSTSAPAAPDSDSEGEADPTGGPFYLKHQNAALASELYAYRRRIYLLEREREWRRKECGVVGEKVRVLEGVWRGMEEGLGLVSFLDAFEL